MQTLTNRIGRPLLAGFAALSLSASALFATSAPVEGAERFRFMSPQSQSCAEYPLIVMEAFGLATKFDLEVTHLDARTDVPDLALLSSREAEAIMLGAADVIAMANADLPGAAVYEAYQYAPLAILVPADSPVATLMDLSGATIGLASARDQVAVIVALEAAGVATRDVTMVIIGDSVPVVAHALSSPTIDAYAGGTAMRALIEAEDVFVRNVTPPEAAQAAPVAITAWTPRFDDLDAVMGRFLKAWSMSRHAGLIDQQAIAAACRLALRDEWRDQAAGNSLLESAIYTYHLRRTRAYGEIQSDVWEHAQAPLLALGEIGEIMHPQTFTDERWIETANDWTTAEVRDLVFEWRVENRDSLLP